VGISGTVSKMVGAFNAGEEIFSNIFIFVQSKNADMLWSKKVCSTSTEQWRLSYVFVGGHIHYSNSLCQEFEAGERPVNPHPYKLWKYRIEADLRYGEGVVCFHISPTIG
jgi:hypothetical protein